MSAQVTEAHRKLAADLCRNATGSNRALHHVPKFAQAIADSEAKAVAEITARAERAEAEVDELKDGLRDSEAALALNTLRAERAEAAMKEGA